MKTLKSLFARLAFAALVLSLGGAVIAAPTYHVAIDTSSLGSGSAYLGLTFLSLDGADSSATVSDLTGDLTGVGTATGAVSGSLPGELVFEAAGGGGDFVQQIVLGGLFSFDVSFVVGTGDLGSAFSWSLFNDTQYLGVNGDLGSIFLTPTNAPNLQVALPVPSQFTSVSAVPEPASFALVLTGMGLAALATRRLRRRKADGGLYSRFLSI